MEEVVKKKIPQLCYYGNSTAIRFSVVPNKDYSLRMCFC